MPVRRTEFRREQHRSITATLAGGLEFVDKIESVVGLHPATRTIGLVSAAATNVRNYLNSSGDTGEIPDTSTEMGGYPSPTVFVINPNNATHVNTYWGGNSMPAVGIRDTIAGNGRTHFENFVLSYVPSTTAECFVI